MFWWLYYTTSNRGYTNAPLVIWLQVFNEYFSNQGKFYILKIILNSESLRLKLRTLHIARVNFSSRPYCFIKLTYSEWNPAFANTNRH